MRRNLIYLDIRFSETQEAISKKENETTVGVTKVLLQLDERHMNRNSALANSTCLLETGARRMGRRWVKNEYRIRWPVVRGIPKNIVEGRPLFSRTEW